MVGMCVHALKTRRFISLLQGQVPLCFAFIMHQGTWFSIPRMVRDVAPSSTSLLLATWWSSTSLRLATVGAVLYPRSPSPRGIQRFGFFFGGDTVLPMVN